MVRDELVIVFPRFLETQQEDDELLTPVCGLHEVVPFQIGLHLPMGVICERRSVLNVLPKADDDKKIKTNRSKMLPYGRTMWATGT